MGYNEEAGSAATLNRPNTMTYGVTMPEQSNRTCRICGEAKPLGDYYKETKGGHKRHCKPCLSARKKAYRAANVEKIRLQGIAQRQANPEKYAESQRKSRQKNAEAIRQRQVAYRKANREEIRKKAHTAHGRARSARAAKRWKEGNPEKARAQLLAQRAVLRGELQRAPCEVCSSTPTQGHHDDYSKPLEVRWL